MMVSGGGEQCGEQQMCFHQESSDFLSDQLPGCSTVVLHTEEFTLNSLAGSWYQYCGLNRPAYHLLQDVVGQPVEIHLQLVAALVWAHHLNTVNGKWFCLLLAPACGC